MSLLAIELKPSELQKGGYWLNGTDAFLKERADGVFREILEPNSLGLHIFDKINEISEVFTALDTLSFTGDDNVVLIRDGGYKPTDADRAMLDARLKQEIDGYLVFIEAGFLTPTQKKLLTSVECKSLDKYAALKIIENMAENGIERQAVNLLWEYTGGELAKIKTEVNKLCSYTRSKITTEDVETCVSEDAELQIFAFANSVADGKTETAVRQLDKLRKRGESQAFILSSLVNQFRRMWYAKISPLSDKELAELTGVKEFAIAKARSNNQFGKLRLKKILDALVGYEWKFKSGEMSEQTAFDAAVSRLIGKETL